MVDSKLPYISVIVTAYNRKEFLLKAIKSVVNQTLDKKYYEIIVIKNYRDEIIDDYIKNNHVIGIVSREESLTGKLVEALDIANGYVISFLEDDDLFSEDKLETIYNKFKHNHNLCYYHNAHININDKYQKFEIDVGNSIVFNLSSISVLKSILNLDNLKKIDSYSADHFMYFSALDSNKKILDGKLQLTYYMVHNSASHSLTASNELLDYNENLFSKSINDLTLFKSQFKRRRAAREIFNSMVTLKIAINVIRKLHNQNVTYIIPLTDIIKWLFIFSYYDSKKDYFFKYFKLLELYVFSDKTIRKIEYSFH